MPGKRFLMNAGRTTKQGQQINIGKDTPEYIAMTTTITMHPDDMKEARRRHRRQRPRALRQRRGGASCARKAKSRAA